MGIIKDLTGLNWAQGAGPALGVFQGFQARAEAKDIEKKLNELIARYGEKQGMDRVVPGHPEIKTPTQLVLYNYTHPGENLKFETGSLGQEQATVGKALDQYNATNLAGTKQSGEESLANLQALSQNVQGAQAANNTTMNDLYTSRGNDIQDSYTTGYKDVGEGYDTLGGNLRTGYDTLGGNVDRTMTDYLAQSDPMYQSRTGAALGTLDTSQGAAQGELTGLRSRVMGDLAKVGKQRATDISQSYGKQLEASLADIQGRGMGASSLGYGASVATEREKSADLNRLAEDLALMRANADTDVTGRIAEGARQGGVTRATMGAALSGDQLANLANIASERAGYQSNIGQAGLTAGERVGLAGNLAQERGVTSAAQAQERTSGQTLAQKDTGQQRALGLLDQYGHETNANQEYWNLKNLNADLEGQQAKMDWTRNYGQMGRDFSRDVLGQQAAVLAGSAPPQQAYYDIPGIIAGAGNTAVANRQAELARIDAKRNMAWGLGTNLFNTGVGAATGIYGANTLAGAWQGNNAGGGGYGGAWSPWQVGQTYQF